MANKAPIKLFISYSWRMRPDAVRKMARYLKQKDGYDVWIDIDNMTDKADMIDSVAQGIRNADVVLCFYSADYNNSANCRREVEFAYSKRKVILPIQVEPNYEPKGFLLLLFGASFRIDYSDDELFSKARDAILSFVIQGSGKEKEEETSIEEVTEYLPNTTNVKKQKLKLFISYSWSVRKEAVAKMAERLQKEAGFQVWIDEKNITDKPSTKQAMIQGSKDADVMLSFLSDKYAKSKNCQKEFEFAVNKGKPIIPLLVEKGYELADELSFDLGNSFRIDFFYDSQFEIAEKRICDILHYYENQ